MELIDIQNKENLESKMKDDRRYYLSNLIKAIGVPALSLAGIVGGAQVIVYPIENHDLQYILNISLSAAAGSFFGHALLEYSKDKFEDAREALSSYKGHRKELKSLNRKR